MKKQAHEDGNESDNDEEIYDDIPVR